MSITNLELSPLEIVFTPLIKKEITIFNENKYGIEFTDFIDCSFYKTPNDIIVLETSGSDGLLRRTYYQFENGTVVEEITKLERSIVCSEGDWIAL